VLIGVHVRIASTFEYYDTFHYPRGWQRLCDSTAPLDASIAGEDNDFCYSSSLDSVLSCFESMVHLLCPGQNTTTCVSTSPRPSPPPNHSHIPPPKPRPPAPRDASVVVLWATDDDVLSRPLLDAITSLPGVRAVRIAFDAPLRADTHAQSGLLDLQLLAEADEFLATAMSTFSYAAHARGLITPHYLYSETPAPPSAPARAPRGRRRACWPSARCTTAAASPQPASAARSPRTHAFQRSSIRAGPTARPSAASAAATGAPAGQGEGRLRRLHLQPPLRPHVLELPHMVHAAQVPRRKARRSRRRRRSGPRLPLPARRASRCPSSSRRCSVGRRQHRCWAGGWGPPGAGGDPARVLGHPAGVRIGGGCTASHVTLPGTRLSEPESRDDSRLRKPRAVSHPHWLASFIFLSAVVCNLIECESCCRSSPHRADPGSAPARGPL
jgi:hypothetical protein